MSTILIQDLPGEELVVDNFAGGGGASRGIYEATGREPDIAVNHNVEALVMHAANHPHCRHFCEDVFNVDPRALVAGRRVGLAWFSPDCKDFSKAKGGKPRSKKIRGLAWVAVKWAELVKPRVIALENVEEFEEWGPLMQAWNETRQAFEWLRDPARKGETFQRFVGRLRRAGYVVEWRRLRAHHYGAPTIRRRLVLLARCDGRPIVWPAATHGAPESAEVMSGKLRPYRIAAECIDWSIPCPSIFERQKPLADATMRRIARGIWKFVVNAPTPFVVRVAHAESANGVKRWGPGVHSVDEPLGTMPASNEFAVAVPHVSKFRQGATGFPLDEPFHTVTAGGATERPGTGNAMGMVEAKLAPIITPVTHAGDTRVHDAAEPFRTVTGAHRGEFALAAATLIQTGFGERDGQSPRVPGLEKPLGTVMGGGVKHAQVAAFLAKHYSGEQIHGSSMEEPVHTVTSVDHNALVTAQIIGAGGPAYSGKPRSVGEPVNALTTENHGAVVAAHLQRNFGQSVGHGLGDPSGTITADGGGHSAVVTSHLAKLYGTTTGQDLREPLHTVTGGGNHIAEVRAFLIKYYSEGGQDQGLDEPLHTIPTHDRIGLVTIEGEEYVITDIGMRMLQPHELFAAQGFPPDYIIAPQVPNRHGRMRTMPKHAQVRMCGNSVPPPLARAIVAANLPELSTSNFEERVA